MLENAVDIKYVCSNYEQNKAINTILTLLVQQKKRHAVFDCFGYLEKLCLISFLGLSQHVVTTKINRNESSSAKITLTKQQLLMVLNTQILKSN